MKITSQKYLPLFFGVFGGGLAGVGISQGGTLFTLFALAFLWESKSSPLAGFLWGGVATLISHRWLLALHPLTWLGVPELLSLPVSLMVWLFCSLFGALLVGCWCFLGNTPFLIRLIILQFKENF